MLPSDVTLGKVKRKSVVRDNKGMKSHDHDQLLIKCFHNYTTIDSSPAFMFYTDMKFRRKSHGGKHVFHVVSILTKEDLGLPYAAPDDGIAH